MGPRVNDALTQIARTLAPVARTSFAATKHKKNKSHVIVLAPVASLYLYSFLCSREIEARAEHEVIVARRNHGCPRVIAGLDQR